MAFENVENKPRATGEGFLIISEGISNIATGLFGAGGIGTLWGNGGGAPAPGYYGDQYPPQSSPANNGSTFLILGGVALAVILFFALKK